MDYMYSMLLFTAEPAMKPAAGWGLRGRPPMAVAVAKGAAWDYLHF